MKKYLVNKNAAIGFKIKKDVTNLTDENIQSIRVQNELLKNFLKSNNIKPLAFSRDKDGNILMVDYYYDSVNNIPSLQLSMLGVNTLTKKLQLYLVGYAEIMPERFNYFLDEDDELFPKKNCIHVDKLAIQNAFQGQNLGRILLQAIENFARNRNFSYLTLSSLKSYNLFNDITPSANIAKKLKYLNNKYLTTSEYNELYTKEIRDFVSNNYFDKNLFFYTRSGFKKYQCENDDGNNLVKTDLKKLSIAYGFNSPLVCVSPKDSMFGFSKDDCDPIATAYRYQKINLFPEFKNSISPKNFVPLNFDYTKEDTELLKKALSSLSFSLPDNTRIFFGIRSFSPSEEYSCFVDKKTQQDFINDPASFDLGSE